jgi:hypothetical protein
MKLLPSSGACAAMARHTRALSRELFNATTNTPSKNEGFVGAFACRMNFSRAGQNCRQRLQRRILPSSSLTSNRSDVEASRMRNPLHALQRSMSTNAGAGGSIGHAHAHAPIKQQAVDGETVQEMSDTFQSIIKVFCVAASPNW